jgi:hypothetical protein
MITDQYLNNKCSSCLIEKMKSILAIFALNCISSTLGLADWTYQGDLIILAKQFWDFACTKTTF